MRGRILGGALAAVMLLAAPAWAAAPDVASTGTLAGGTAPATDDLGGLEVVDVNADGHLDVAFTHSDPPKVTVHLGRAAARS